MEFLVVKFGIDGTFNVDVFHSVLNAFVAQNFLHIEDVFGFMVEGCSFGLSSNSSKAILSFMLPKKSGNKPDNQRTS